MGKAARRGHSADCIACKDPGALPGLLAAERALLDREAARARLCRQIGEAFRERTLATPVDDPQWPRVHGLMLRFLGDANALASGIQVRRAHLDRVEAAHLPGPP